MKKKTIIKKLTSKITVIGYCLLVICLSSCQDMFEPADENNRTEDAMYEESKYADGLLMYGYGRLPYLTTTTTDVATDDATSNVETNSYVLMATGSWKSDNNPVSVWDACKDGIQYVNLFLKKVELVKWAPSAQSKQQMFIDRLKGEAYGLRALFYYYLLQAHGGYADDGILYGVPLLTTPEDGSSDYNVPRATFADCVKQCFADCDSAMALLPLDYENISTDEEVPAKYKEIGAYVTSYNLVFGQKAQGLLSGKVAEAIKAQVALLAASPAFREQSGVTSAEAATLCANVLKRIGGLEGFDPTGNRDWFQSAYKTMIETVDNPEILWREDRQKNATQERENFPPTLYGNGRVNPSQNLVDAFPMRNGRPITEAASGYDAKNPYANRDPRLEYYILYNGRTLRKSEIITGNYPNDKNEVLDNLNNQKGLSTRTGYYLMKLLRDDVSPLSSSLIEQQHIYPRIRYTDRNERRLELCFENKRFWDIRRWMLPLDESIKGMDIQRDETTGALSYKVFEVETRKYDNAYQCYGPIPKGEVLKWSNLKQNKGWEKN